MGEVSGPQRLMKVDDADFNFKHLEVSEGGEIIFQMLRTPNLQHLVKFSYIVDPLSSQVQVANAQTVGFIELACEASAHSLRHVVISCNFPADRIDFVTNLKKMEVLRVAVFTPDDPIHAFPCFIADCNRLFPVDGHNEASGICQDGLDLYPALKDLNIRLLLPTYPTVYPNISYVIKRTCLGQIKRFLSIIEDRIGYVSCNQYVWLDPMDVVNNVVPEVPVSVRRSQT